HREKKNTEAAIWARLMNRNKPTPSRQAAQSILDLSFSRRDMARMDQLAAKARAGKLSVDEQAEVEGYSHVGSVLGLLKSKARVSLSKKSRSNGKGRYCSRNIAIVRHLLHEQK